MILGRIVVKISENVEGSRATMKGIKRFKRVSSRALSTLGYDNYSNKYGLSSFRGNLRFSLLIWRCLWWKRFAGSRLMDGFCIFELYIEIKIKLSFYTILTFLDSSMQKMLLLSSFPIYIFFFFSEDDFFRKLAWGFLSASRH